jgi:hypothetical protein
MYISMHYEMKLCLVENNQTQRVCGINKGIQPEYVSLPEGKLCHQQFNIPVNRQLIYFITVGSSCLTQAITYYIVLM